MAKRVAALASGEHALRHGVNYGPAIVAAAKDPKGCFQAKIIEPVLARINKPYFIVDRAQSPFSRCSGSSFSPALKPKPSWIGLDSPADQSCRWDRNRKKLCAGRLYGSATGMSFISLRNA